eukprot:TRINITY_DN1073_c3_g3_i1.p1 TRINITY_DN1073_c3_g3~~TRINITY_DN1073_c3_g3_i1.p1  ORF type:complete len:1171 (+),score=483.69 TRINITY_DN1073_c3_g3_i1:589-4101(+)
MATLLRPTDLEDLREWSQTFKKAWRQKHGKKRWDRQIPIEDEHVTQWLDGDLSTEHFTNECLAKPQSLLSRVAKILYKRYSDQSRDLDDPLTLQGVLLRMQSLRNDLRRYTTKTGSETMELDSFLRYFSTDPKTRFDIQFVLHQRRVEKDRLGGWLYLPFIALFTYFLVEGKQLGNGFWMTSALVDKFSDEEFTNSDDLRYKKTFFDIANADEFWQFIEGPVVESLWQNDDNAPEQTVLANQWVQTSNMPVGAIKLRQVRIEGRACPDSWREILENHYWTLPPDRVLKRVDDFSALCYPEYAFISTDNPPGMVDTGTGGSSYELVSTIHSGHQLHNQDGNYTHPGAATPAPDCPDPSANCAGRTRFPPSYLFRRTISQQTNKHELVQLSPADAIVHEAFMHRTCGQLNGSVYGAFAGHAGEYLCDGHALILPFDWDLAKVKKAIAHLKDGLHVTYWDPFANANATKTLPWIDHQTRGISVEFFLYSQNLAVTLRLQFFVEVTAGGAFVPNLKTTLFKLFDWEDRGPWYWVFFFLYAFWILGYVVHWVFDVVHHTSINFTNLSQSEMAAFNGTCKLRLYALAETFTGFWIWFDFCNLALFITSWGLRIRGMAIGMTEENLLQNRHYPSDYEDAAAMSEMASLVSAINAMLVYLRLFYFLKLNPRLNLLTKTIEEASAELLGIVVIFLFVFVAFALMCYTVYGHIDENYRTFQDTCISLVLMLLGDFDFVALREGRREFTPIFFALFQLLVVFLLFNMVIAVLGDAFSTVQAKKYRDGPLVKQLLRKSETPERWEGNWEVPHAFLCNPVVVESTYRLKSLVLWLKHMYGWETPAGEVAGAVDEEEVELKSVHAAEEAGEEAAAAAAPAPAPAARDHRHRQQSCRQRAAAFVHRHAPCRLLDRGGKSFFCCRLQPQDEEYLRQKDVLGDQNPIVYWKKLEDDFYVKKISTPFKDFLHLTSTTLHDTVDDRMGDDAVKLLENPDTGEEGLVLQGARDTFTQPDVLLQDVLEFHHSWNQEVSGKTHQGNAAEWAEEKELRADQQDEVDFAKDPQGRWEMLKKVMRQFDDDLRHVVPDAADDDGRMKGCGTRRVDVLETLKGQVQSAVQGEIDALIRRQVDSTLHQLLDESMPTWVRSLVTEDDVKREHQDVNAMSWAGPGGDIALARSRMAASGK